MLKAWDQADIDVDLGYCRGTAVLRRVALKSEGSRRDGRETSANDASQEACPTFLW
jgi:hypothetical protein